MLHKGMNRYINTSFTFLSIIPKYLFKRNTNVRFKYGPKFLT